MFERRRFHALSALLLFFLVAGVSCTEDPTPPDPSPRLPFGVHAVPRGAPGSDPLMAEAYSDIARGHFAWSQAEIDWGVIETQIGTRSWQSFDDHLRQSLRTGVPLSLVVRIVDESHLGPFPDDLRGQGLGSPNVRVHFPAFVKAVVERSRGQLSQLWIGRAIDLRLTDHPDELNEFLELYTLAADSVRSIAPDLPIGTSFTYSGAPLPDAVSALRPHLDRIGWAVLPLDGDHLPSSEPEEALELVREAVAAQSGLPIVLTEVGYSRAAGDAEADRFLSGLHGFLETAPAHLVGVTWFGLYDWDLTRANERAAALHPNDPEGMSAHAAWLRSSGLGRVNGVPTSLWFRAFEWNQGR